MGLVLPIHARTRKGDRLLAQGRTAEEQDRLDEALDFDRAAMAEDPSDALYQLTLRRVRFKAGEMHVKEGRKIRTEGKLAEALAEFQRASVIDPASPIALQEIQRTKEMMERENRKATQPGGAPEDAANRGLTPIEVARKETLQRIDSMESVPQLRPLNPQLINLKMSNQRPRVLFETLGKMAGVNVLFDPDFDQQNNRPQSIELTNSTLNQSLDYVALLTRSFWKPLSANAIFVTQDNTTKRRDYEEQVVRVFYLKNVTLATDLTEVITALRTVVDIQKMFQYTSQNAIVIRCEADKMLLAEKIINDLDKPRSEVLVDVIVLEVSSDVVRNLGAQIAPGGISTTAAFTPTRAGILGTATTSTTSSSTLSGTTSTTGTTTTSTTNTIPLNNLKKISSGDFSVTGIPGGFVEALLTDTTTKVLQSPQLRAVDNAKVSLHIGDKVPTASGSFGSGIGGVGVGVSPLVQTSFTYIETGVNMDMKPRVNDSSQISLHVEIDISQVSGYRDVGGIQQPIISQRKIAQDIRTEEGEINLIGGLIQEQNSKTKSGLPFLSNVPLLNRLFTDEKTEKSKRELLITLVPHLIRAPDVGELNMRTVSSGSTASYHVTLNSTAPQPARAASPTAAPTAGTAGAAAPIATAPPTPAPAPTAPAGSATVAFLPAQVDTQVNTAGTVTLRVENVNDLNSVLAQLKFDPRIIRDQFRNRRRFDPADRAAFKPFAQHIE